jgi:hypothetical protein
MAPERQELTRMSRVGLGTNRLTLTWRTIEPDPPVEVAQRSVHNYHWESFDSRIRALARAGLRPHLGFYGVPTWVGSPHGASPWQSQQGRQNWPRFVAAAVQRYGPRGDFWMENPNLPHRPPLTYQIWNEQNSTNFYAPRVSPAEYSRVLVSAAKAIKQRHRGAEVVPGGMFGTPHREGSMSAWRFLRKLLEQPGVRRHSDAVAVHPYAPNLRGVRYQIRRIRSVLRRNGAARMPLKVTEIGWSSEPARDSGAITRVGLKGQERLTNRAMRMLLQNRRKWRLNGVIWFIWRDITSAAARETGCIGCRKMGLFRRDLKPKPAFGHFSRHVRAARAGRR